MGIPNFALKHTKCLAYKVSSTTPQVDKSDEPADKRSQQDCHIAVHFTFFPTLTCGVFVFSSVSAPSSSRPHSLTHWLSDSLTHWLTDSLTHYLPHSLTPSLTHSLTPSLTHTHLPHTSHSPPTHLPLTSHSPPTHLPLTSHSPPTHLPSPHLTSPHSPHFAWQAWDNVHCQGSDVRPGIPLASLWCPLGSAAFAWQAWDKGSDVRPGVPHPSITLILPLPFLLFYAQSKSREVGNMWGYPVTCWTAASVGQWVPKHDWVGLKNPIRKRQSTRNRL